MADPPPGKKPKRGSKRKSSTSTPRVRPPLITPASKIARVTQTQEYTSDDVNVFSPPRRTVFPSILNALCKVISSAHPRPAALRRNWFESNKCFLKGAHVVLRCALHGRRSSGWLAQREEVAVAAVATLTKLQMDSTDDDDLVRWWWPGATLFNGYFFLKHATVV